MTQKTEVLISREFLSNSEITDEQIFRDLCQRIVNDIPFSELSKLIHFTKTDPNSEASIEMLKDFRTSDFEREQLLRLQLQSVVLYEAEICL